MHSIMSTSTADVNVSVFSHMVCGSILTLLCIGDESALSVVSSEAYLLCGSPAVHKESFNTAQR